MTEFQKEYLKKNVFNIVIVLLLLFVIYRQFAMREQIDDLDTTCVIIDGKVDDIKNALYDLER